MAVVVTVTIVLGGREVEAVVVVDEATDVDVSGVLGVTMMTVFDVDEAVIILDVVFVVIALLIRVVPVSVSVVRLDLPKTTVEPLTVRVETGIGV